MNFSIVVAATEKTFSIGKNGDLPWKLTNEYKYFREITTTITNGTTAIENNSEVLVNENSILDSSTSTTITTNSGGSNKIKTKKKKKMNAVIMGRRTFESIPVKNFPLKNRLNVILTRNQTFKSKISTNYTTISEEEVEESPGNEIDNSSSSSSSSVLICSDFPSALHQLSLRSDVASVFVIGGESVYREALQSPFCQKIYFTRILMEFPGCDTFFPPISNRDFVLDDQYHSNETQIENGIPYKFQLYHRRHDETQYLNLVERVLVDGIEKHDRTGIGTFSLFGSQLRFSLRDADRFPLLTTKKVFWKAVVEELLWFINGSTFSKTLSQKGVKIWDQNGTRQFLDGRGLSHYEEGDLGPIYGFQWRHWGAEYTGYKDNYNGKGIDQLKQCIDTIKKDPDSRRILMTAWNCSDLEKMALPPCHVLCQFYVTNKKELSCLMYQRSCDLGLGVPFNIASYALLTCMVAQVCGLKRGEFVHMLGDTHVYKNHVEQLKEQLKREPFPFPILKLNPNVTDIDDFKTDDIQLLGYKSHDVLKMQMAV